MRKLSEAFMQDLLNGCLAGFLSAVQTDDTLALEIRGNYINIYYRGGNIYRISPRRNGYSIFFDKKYASAGIYLDLPEPNNYEAWLSLLPELKDIMDLWFEIRPKTERECQQCIVSANSRGAGTDYLIVDIEYANSEIGGRFDMIGINRTNAEKLRMAFFELKCGSGAVAGKSGIKKHMNDIYSFLKDNKKKASVCTEIEGIVSQKQRLGLLPPADGDIVLSGKKPEFILLFFEPATDTEWRIIAREIEAAYNSDAYHALSKICIVKFASLYGFDLYAKDQHRLPPGRKSDIV